MPSSLSAFEELNAKFGSRWSAISKARSLADEQKAALKNLIDPKGDQLPLDANLVIFGSMARAEWTCKSDIDWTLLVDGQTAPEHMRVAKRIEQSLLTDGWTKPNPAGAFGSLAFSHPLVHEIGGPSDSHVNTTRRVLLLLESRAIGDRSVRDRVVRAILSRYLEEYTHFHPSKISHSFIPRFLLNDVVRYWRIIAVDYANKTRNASQKGWALRNVKLRMSRKMIFVSGLLMCFRCHLEHQDIQSESEANPSGSANAPFISFLSQVGDGTPLDTVASTALKYNLSDDTVRLIFDNYDEFLSVIDDPEKRDCLENLELAKSFNDDLFNHMREIGRHFQEGLRRLFFEDVVQIRDLSQIYAIF